jgi:hypothetical protein
LIGTTEQSLELDANEEVTIPFEALVPKAGVHNLQMLRFVVQQHEQQQQQQQQEDATTHHLSQQWLIHLVDSS